MTAARTDRTTSRTGMQPPKPAIARPPRAGGDSGERPLTIAVLLPMVWSVRNVVHSGVLGRLADAGADVHLLFHRLPGRDEWPAIPGRAAGVHEMVVPPGASPRTKALVDGILLDAFSRHHGIGSHAIYEAWRNSSRSRPQRAKAAAHRLAGALAQSKWLLRRLERVAERMYRTAHDLDPVHAQLAELQPDLVWSTVCVAPGEYPYALATRDLGIPCLTSILSFDNLTSRGTLPRYDRYLVWCDAMRDQLLRLYPRIHAQVVEVTGTPQFDFHRSPDGWSRERTVAELGLPAGSRYVLHAASHESLAPDEPELVARLSQLMRQASALSGHHLVVRLHPLADRGRWAAAASLPAVTLSQAWSRAPAGDGWTLSNAEDQHRLVATFRHADACINVASTATLDSAIVDRPVVGIDLRAVADRPRRILYEEYDADHYRPLVESGGLRVGHDWDEIVALLEESIRSPGRDSVARAGMVARECGQVDGGAAGRVADAVLRAAKAARACLPAR